MLATFSTSTRHRTTPSTTHHVPMFRPIRRDSGIDIVHREDWLLVFLYGAAAKIRDENESIAGSTCQKNRYHFVINSNVILWLGTCCAVLRCSMGSHSETVSMIVLYALICPHKLTVRSTNECVLCWMIESCVLCAPNTLMVCYSKSDNDHKECPIKCIKQYAAKRQIQKHNISFYYIASNAVDVSIAATLLAIGDRPTILTSCYV